MKKSFYLLAFFFIPFFSMSAHALTIPAVNGKCETGWTLNSSGSCTSNHTGNGAGGSWGDDTGFPGNGGGFNGGGSGGSWGETCQITRKHHGGQIFDSPSAACSASIGQTYSSSGTMEIIASVYDGAEGCFETHKRLSSGVTDQRHKAFELTFSGCDEEPECPDGQVFQNGQCIVPLVCPAGYIGSNGKCVWACPAGSKMVGGNCVPDNQPTDCDPAIQNCDSNGEPSCDICAKLTGIMSNQSTLINNNNRLVSLSETMTSNQHQSLNEMQSIRRSVGSVNSNLSIANANLSTVNRNLSTIDNSISEVINAINTNRPDFDTTAIENKLDQLINKEVNPDVGAGEVDIDLTELLSKLDVINQSIVDNSYSDTELRADIDALNVPLDNISNAIDNLNNDVTASLDTLNNNAIATGSEQTGWLKNISGLLNAISNKITGSQSCDSEDCSDGEPPIDVSDVPLEELQGSISLDPWAAIKGFDISQNRINASQQCPSGDIYSFDFYGKHFALPMNIFCDALGKLAPAFLFLAYMGGAFIIVKGSD